MYYKTLGSVRISRLGIGTAQFGLGYGIANRKGNLPSKQILPILYTARETRVNAYSNFAANSRYISHKPLDDSAMHNIDRHFYDVPENIVNPYLWDICTIS